MNLIFCRHGETKFNLEDRFQGISDSPLSEKGIKQAQSLNKFLTGNFNVKEFFISPLPRVHQTYEYASAGIEAELHVVEELKEVCYGDWEGVERTKIDQKLLEEKEKDRFRFIHPGEFNGIKGESYKDEYERIISFLKYLSDTRINTKEDTVIIAHNGVMIGVMKYFGGLSDEEAGKLRISNDDVVIVNKFNMIEVKIESVMLRKN